MVREERSSGRGQRVQLVTEARPSMSDDISYRQRRYLIMMAIRAVCLIVSVILFANHLGWYAAIPVAGAIAIPYIAVVFANGGREPSNTRGFRPYEPSTPLRYAPPATGPGAAAGPGGSAPPAATQMPRPQADRTDHGTPGGNGVPPQNA